MTIQRILFPVAFSDRCQGAAAPIQALAERFQAELTLLHVVETQYTIVGAPEMALLPDDQTTAKAMEDGRVRLENFKRLEFRWAPAACVVEDGDAATTIVDYARTHNIDLIAMPTHAYGPFRRFILGSVTAKVLHDVETPVWTSAHAEEIAEAGPITRVLCAVDLQKRSLCTLKWAAAFATAWNAQLDIVHVIPAPEARPGIAEESKFRKFLYDYAHEQLAELQCAAGTQAEVHVQGGDVARGVRDLALERRADVLVIGRSTHNMLGRLRTHSYAIIRESPVAVISI